MFSTQGWVRHALKNRYQRDFNLSKSLQALHQLLPFGLSSLVNHEDLFVYVAHEITYAGSSQYQDLFMPKIERPSPDLKLRLAYKFILSQHPNDIRFIFPELSCSSDTSSQSNIRGSLLMHCLAAKLSQMMAPVWLWPGDQLEEMCRWTRRCAAVDPEGIHHQLSAEDAETLTNRKNCLCEGITPLWVFVAGLLHKVAANLLVDPAISDSTVSLDHFLDETLPVWLSLLQQGGIDLREYGRKERELSKTMPSLSRFRLMSIGDANISETLSAWVRLRIIAIDFGPNISDWVVWRAWEYEHFAKEFWDLVENPPCHVPGSWEESFSPWASEQESARAYVDLDDEVDVIWTEVPQPESTESGAELTEVRYMWRVPPRLEPTRLDDRVVVSSWR